MRFFYSLWFFILLLKVNQSAQQNAQKCSVINVADNMLVIGDTEDSNYGDVLRFSCKFPTQALYGNAEIFCTEDGEWSDSPPECKGITCDRPQIEHGSVSGDAQIYNENEYLTFECNGGYKRAEERPSKCSKVGDRAQWTPTLACEPVSCKVTLLQGTQYDPPYRNVFSPGETLTVTCDNNHWISNKQTSSVVTRCKNDGGWTIDPVCHEFTCSRPQDRSVYSFYPYGGEASKLGSTAWYNCKTGFRKPVNNGRATCTRAGWRPNPLCREITCPRKEYPNAQIVGDIESEYKYNQRVEYVCNNGFEGTFTITCQERGWSRDTAPCREVFCGKYAIEHAQISNNDKEIYQHSEKVKYTCTDSDYVLTLTCENGDWTGNKSCPVFPPCGSPPALKDGDITDYMKSNYSNNEQVEYMCMRYYTMEGDPHRTCIRGEWTGHQRCIKPCIVREDDMRPQNVTFKSSSSRYFSHDALIEFRCVRGVPVGDAALSQRCNSGSFFLPTCREF